MPPKAGNKVQHHGHGCGADDDHEQRLDHAIVCLQETNHGWLNLQPSKRGKPGLRAAAWFAAMRGAPAYARFSLDATLPL